jgi:D-glycero-D-manno-heptose 1,7-bisphosphate phosphatase
MRDPRQQAVFLDRDGTLNVEKEYLSDPEALVLFPNLGPALRSLSQTGFGLFIVTNQSGIGRGLYTEDAMRRVNARLCEHLEREDVRFDHIYFAAEAPDQPSPGRKPSPQFLHDARDRFGVDLGRSYMVGDKMSDLECGWNAGVRRSLLVRTGYGAFTENQLTPEQRGRTIVVEDCVEAAQWILRDGGES